MALLSPRIRQQVVQSILAAARTGDMRHLTVMAYSWLLHIELFHNLQDYDDFLHTYQRSGRFKADLLRAQGALLVGSTPGEVVLHALQEQNAGMLAEILQALGDKSRVRRVHRDDCPKYCTRCTLSGKTAPIEARA